MAKKIRPATPDEIAGARKKIRPATPEEVSAAQGQPMVNDEMADILRQHPDWSAATAKQLVDERKAALSGAGDFAGQARAWVQGATLNHAPQALGLMGENVDEERKTYAKATNEHPLAYLAGSYMNPVGKLLGGGVGSAALQGGLAAQGSGEDASGIAKHAVLNAILAGTIGKLGKSLRRQEIPGAVSKGEIVPESTTAPQAPAEPAFNAASTGVASPGAAARNAARTLEIPPEPKTIPGLPSFKVNTPELPPEPGAIIHDKPYWLQEVTKFLVSKAARAKSLGLASAIPAIGQAADAAGVKAGEAAAAIGPKLAPILESSAQGLEGVGNLVSAMNDDPEFRQEQREKKSE